MSLPISNTTISVMRSVSTDDSLPIDSPAVLASHIAAVIRPKSSGREDQVGGSKALSTYLLNADTNDLRHTDLVLDESSQQLFDVIFAVYRAGLGLDHMYAELQLVQGMA